MTYKNCPKCLKKFETFKEFKCCAKCRQEHRRIDHKSRLTNSHNWFEKILDKKHI